VVQRGRLCQQRATEELEGLWKDLAALQDAGDAVQVTQGAFDLMPSAPEAADAAFADRLAVRDVFVLPGKFLKMPGTFRVCLTATEGMVERSLPEFRELGARC
jgi:aspartate aminotransferase